MEDLCSKWPVHAYRPMMGLLAALVMIENNVAGVPYRVSLVHLCSCIYGLITVVAFHGNAKLPGSHCKLGEDS
jgi:hypothetical protein